MVLWLGVLLGTRLGLAQDLSPDKVQLEVEGVGVVVDGDRAAAWEIARAEARERALERVVSQLVAPKKLVAGYEVLRDEVYSKPEKFMVWERVVGRKAGEAGLCRLRLAVEVDVGALRLRLAELGLLDQERAEALGLQFQADRYLVQVVVFGVNDQQLEDLKGVLEEVAGDGEGKVHVRYFSPGMARLVVEFAAGARVLAEKLTGNEWGDFSLRLVSVSSGRLELRFVPRESLP